jgi:hypothetical protein
MEIRSYRRVFDLERRIYRVDRLRLNPGGVPVRGVVYFLLILSSALLVSRMPIASLTVSWVPWYLRDLALPAGWATVLSVIRVEGRPFHLAALAVLRYRLGARRTTRLCRCCAPGRRWYPQEILMLPDGSDARMRRLRYTGPGAVLIAVEHERACPRPEATRRAWRRSPSVLVRELAGRRPLDRGQVVALGAGVRLLVRSGAAGDLTR